MENSFEIFEVKLIGESNFKERVAFIEKAQSIAKTEIENEKENFFDKYLD